MTNTATTPEYKVLDANTVAGVAQYLTPLVHNLIALSVNAKQAHWHVRGANFLGVHEFLDTLHKNAIEAYDEAAERIVALGLPLDARITTVAANATNPEQGTGFQQYRETIADILAQIDAVLETGRNAVEGLDEIDLVSQDVAIGIVAQFDKDRWFLYSLIAE